MKILVVDDSRPIYMMVSSMLEERSIEHDWAKHGKEAIVKVKDTCYDLILLDWNMPEMTGPEFLEYNLKEKITTIPVVMMTTENKPDYIRRALELGASEYIMKPFTGDILFNKINLVLGLEE